MTVDDAQADIDGQHDRRIGRRQRGTSNHQTGGGSQQKTLRSEVQGDREAKSGHGSDSFDGVEPPARSVGRCSSRPPPGQHGNQQKSDPDDDLADGNRRLKRASSVDQAAPAVAPIATITTTNVMPPTHPIKKGIAARFRLGDSRIRMVTRIGTGLQHYATEIGETCPSAVSMLRQQPESEPAPPQRLDRAARRGKARSRRAQRSPASRR